MFDRVLNMPLPNFVIAIFVLNTNALPSSKLLRIKTEIKFFEDRQHTKNRKIVFTHCLLSS